LLRVIVYSARHVVEIDNMSRNRRSRTPMASKHVDFTARASTRTEEDLTRILEKTASPFLLILDCVQDPHNLGACIRTAGAVGVHAVIAPKDRAASLTDTVRRIAAGAAERVPFVKVTNLARTIVELQEAGVRVIGTSDQAKATLYDTDLTGPLAIAMGGEESGLRRLTQDRCDAVVRIPMSGSVDCLNVSVATGVCVFEAHRQRST
jgi:23S rRNA (guanosine2251-2'-O)-methyltransferase